MSDPEDQEEAEEREDGVAVTSTEETTGNLPDPIVTNH